MDHTERGDIVVGWLARVTTLLLLLGVASYDAVAVGVATVSVTDQASTAARAARDAWARSRTVQAAYDAAVQSATRDNPANVVAVQSFRVDPDGTVRLRVDRTARTLLLERVPPMRGWAEVGSDAVARKTL